MNFAAVDFESYWDDDESDPCSISVLGTDSYILHRKWECYQVAIVTTTGLEWVGYPKDAPWQEIAGDDWEWCAQNAGFDERVHYYLREWGVVPNVGPRLWNCTADLCAFSAAPRALAKAASYLYGEKVSKDYRGKMKCVRFAELSPEKQADVRAAGIIDAKWALRFWIDLSPKWYETERRISRLSRQQSWRGLRMDVARIDRGIKHLQLICWAAENMIPFSPALSHPALVAQCLKEGIDAPPEINKNSDACAAWEDRHGDKFKWVDAMRQLRSANGFLKKLETMRARILPNGRMGYQNKYFGAHCVSGETELLTRAGWVSISAWPGGEIAQWSPSNEVRFLPAIANKFDVNEPSMVLDAPYAKGHFTKGHTIPFFQHASFAFNTIKAGDITRKGSSYVPISGTLSGTGAINSDQMRLLVAVQADGHWTPDGALLFTLRKQRKIDRLAYLLDLLSIPFRQQVFPSSPTQTRISVSRKDCPSWLAKDRKVFGAWLLDSTPHAREAFAEEIAKWDGWTPTTANKNRQYYSAIRANAEWVQTMMHLTGRATQITTQISREGNQHFTCTLRETMRAMPFKRHWSDGPRLTKAFCPTTQTGFWLYRYKGTIGVTGNTGRWGDGDEGNRSSERNKGFNSRNLPQKEKFGEEWLLGKLKKDGTREPAEGKNFVHLFPDGKIEGVNLRYCIIPEDGHKFVIPDLRQIEPRVCWQFAGDKASLDFVRQGMSPYEANGRTKMGYVKPEPMEEGDPDGYRLSKAQVISLDYQAGFEKFVTMASTYVSEEDCIRIFSAPVTEQETKAFEVYLGKYGSLTAKARYKTDETIRVTFVNSWKIVTNFRRTNPLITGSGRNGIPIGLWKRLDNALRLALSKGEDLEIELPSGRCLTYRKIAMVDGQTTGIIIRNGTPCRVNLYGGKLTENVCQAVARDIFVEGLLRLDDEGHWVALHSHDEAACEVPLSVDPEEIKLIMAQAPTWMADLPVESSCKVAMHYTK